MEYKEKVEELKVKINNILEKIYEEEDVQKFVEEWKRKNKDAIL